MTENHDARERVEDEAPTPAAVMGGFQEPWVQMKYYSFHPCIYPGMIKAVSPNIPPGSIVYVYDKEGRPFGNGIFNPKARVPLRAFHHGKEFVGEEDLDGLVENALALRKPLLADASTDAFRVIHSDGDGLSGLVVDRFADVLSIEVHSLGMAQRIGRWIPRLHEVLGTKRALFDVDPQIARMEGIGARFIKSDDVRAVRIREHGIRYEVDFATGHKTGFFCDQRENRLRFSRLVEGRRTVDICSYTGGFAIAAKLLGKAESVTGVDLDEKAVAQAKRNANLNQVRIDWIHCDAFSWARQMQRNQQRWGAVLLDPPKLMLNREEAPDGYRKYEDLNRLAVSLVDRGGWFVTCSCSGLLSAAEFEELVCRAGHKQARRLQIVDRTGAATDHPVMSNCPESRYLKVIWARVL